MRYLLMILLTLSLLSCADEKADSKELSNYLPADAAVILKLNNPDLFFSHLKNNEFYRNNDAHPLPTHLREQLSFLQHLEHKNPAILAFSTNENEQDSYTFVQRGIPDSLFLDSIQNKAIETLTSDYGELKRYTLEEQVTFTSSLDSIFLVSNSRQALEAILAAKGRNPLPNQADFQRALKASSESNPVVLINHQNLENLLTQLFPNASLDKLNNFSNWSSLDTEINQGGFKLNGITTATDSLPKLINIFKGVGVTANELALVTPQSSEGFFSFSFQDFSLLHENLRKFNKADTLEESSAANLLATASEAGIIHLKGANVFAIKSLDIEASRIAFPPEGEVLEEFHNLSIHANPAPAAFQFLEPLIPSTEWQYFLYLDQFVLFSEEIESLKEVVRNFQNENTLGNSEAFASSMRSLSTEASLLWVSSTKGLGSSLSEKVSEENKAATAKLDFDQFPIAALQFVYQTDFAHVHAVFEKSENHFESKGIQQVASVKLDAPLATEPFFFKNHRSKGLDIAVQDNLNTLYLISPEGQIYWKKKLDSRIVGDIQQVDLYRNGRIQLAFATQSSVQVIDRVGNVVKPFPLTFRDEITQPLSIFDYDINRQYRFVVVQGKEVYMYNSKGNRVNGFTFNKSAAEIVQPPTHIRLGTKDYIVIAEASGKLNILDRSGKTRVNVKEKLSFSENQWYEYNNNFVSTSAEGELLKIDQNGGITKEALNLADGHKIDATAKTLVSLSDNELTIKGKSISLDFGLYTEPKIFYLNNKIYVSITDTQSHRVFLFDSNGELLPNFPVYGNSLIDLGNADGDAALELVVMGDEDTLLMYEL